MIRKSYSLNLDYSASLGETYSRFMEGLKEGKMLGNKCDKCGRLYVPVRPFCDMDFEKNGDLFEVDPIGEVVSFTVYFIKSLNLPDPPFIQGIIRIGEAANSFLHFIGDVPYEDPAELPEKIRIGMKVKPIWAEDRKGDILDILYFAPA